MPTRHSRIQREQDTLYKGTEHALEGNRRCSEEGNAHLGCDVIGKTKTVAVRRPALQHQQSRLDRRQDLCEQHGIALHEHLLLLLQVPLRWHARPSQQYSMPIDTQEHLPQLSYGVVQTTFCTLADTVDTMHAAIHKQLL